MTNSFTLPQIDLSLAVSPTAPATATNGSQPHDPDNLRFEDLFDLEEIQQIQDAFALATGVASIITDPNGRPITRPSSFCNLCQIIRSTPTGLKNCMHSDAVLGQVNQHGPKMQPCLSGGLIDGGTSIMLGERHIANWLIGQVLEDTANEERMMDYAEKIDADKVIFRQALHDVRHMSREQFEHVCNALFLIARMMSNLALQNAQQARYINERKQAEQEHARLQEQVIEAQQVAIRELSTPLLPLADGVVALPLVGSIDSARAQAVMEALLEGVAQHKATVAIVDITGIQVMDTQVAHALIRSAQAVKLLGAQVILTGVSPLLAQTLVHLEANLAGIVTRRTLQEGIAYALGH